MPWCTCVVIDREMRAVLDIYIKICMPWVFVLGRIRIPYDYDRKKKVCHLRPSPPHAEKNPIFQCSYWQKKMSAFLSLLTFPKSLFYTTATLAHPALQRRPACDLYRNGTPYWVASTPWATTNLPFFCSKSKVRSCSLKLWAKFDFLLI